MGKTIVMFHGRGTKPQKAGLKKSWVNALRWGLQRDYPNRLAAFDRVTFEFVYFGDIINAHLNQKQYDARADAADRRLCLRDLRRLSRSDFSDAERYARLPSVSGAGELFADVATGFLSTMRLSELLIAGVAPDLKEYWNPESDFGSSVRQTAISPLLSAMNRRDAILVVAHSLGSMVAFDSFWKISRTGEYRPKYTNKKVDLFVTLGSPLADETVKRHLKGADLKGRRSYPANVQRWINLAAVDDYECHDENVANDFRRMVEWELTESIEDVRLYNMAVREGKSNPHHSAGYLVHPVMSDILSNWV